LIVWRIADDAAAAATDMLRSSFHRRRSYGE
jgi:hypothetical protein